MKNEDKKIEGAKTPPKRTTTKPIDRDSSRSDDFDQGSFSEQQKHKTNIDNYFFISKRIIRCNHLSPGCRVLILFILGYKDIEHVTMKQLFNHFCKDPNEDEIISYVNEGVLNGYLILENEIVSTTERVNEL